jgi:diguanylate cyclase (GGDEF)-like protein
MKCFNRWLPSLNVSGRLHAVAAASLIGVWSLTYVSVHFSISTRHEAQTLFDVGFVGMSNAMQTQLLLERHRRIVESAPAEVRRDILSRDAQALKSLGIEISGMIGGANSDDLNPLREALMDLFVRGEKVMRLAENLAQDAASDMANVYADSADTLQQRLQETRNTQVANAAKSVAEIVRRTQALILWASGIGAVMVFFLTPVSIFIVRRVLTRLRRIMAVMTRLASNDTRVTVPSVQDPDEVGDIARAVDVFKTNAIELNRQQVDLTNAKFQLDAALSNMPNGLSMFDKNYELVICNKVYAEIYRLPSNLTQPGVPFAEIQRHRAQVLNTAGDIVDSWLDSIKKLLEAGKPHKVVRELGDGRNVQVSYQPLSGGGWVAVHEDITARKRTEAKIEFMAQHDPLTRLPNRSQFQAQLSNAVAELPESGFAVFCLDLDRFKQVNDTLGHAAGDILLQQVSDRLRSCIRKSDVVARIGGDEFAVLQTGVCHHDDSTTLATRIIETVSKPYNLAGSEVTIGVSIGVALAPSDGSDAIVLLQKGDVALYAAKDEGRGVHRFFDKAMDHAARERRLLEQDLRKSFADGGLELHYQPLVALNTRQIVGFEALLRWRHPERGFISPADFIPIAEETGLIVSIGEWVIRQACAEAVRWPDDIRVAVNLSSVQFRNAGLCATVLNAMATSGLSPSKLEFEITESVLLLESAGTLDTLHQLRKLGVKIAMDDFGTGYSSLSYLRSFPFDKIKIDQSFVRDLDTRKDSATIVGAIASLASSLNMSTVAEGVETEEQFFKVRASGCTEAQGWFFGKPVPACEVMNLLAPRNQEKAAA